MVTFGKSKALPCRFVARQSFPFRSRSEATSSMRGLARNLDSKLPPEILLGVSRPTMSERDEQALTLAATARIKARDGMELEFIFMRLTSLSMEQIRNGVCKNPE